jgi:hypothetical protein
MVQVGTDKGKSGMIHTIEKAAVKPPLARDKIDAVKLQMESHLSRQDLLHERIQSGLECLSKFLSVRR